MPRVVISDTSPVHYLVLIGEADLLPALYTEVLIPEAVAGELSQPATPEPVRRWIAHRPAWLQVVPLPARPTSVPPVDLGLDPGEHDAILLALHLKADLVRRLDLTAYAGAAWEAAAGRGPAPQTDSA